MDSDSEDLENENLGNELYCDVTEYTVSYAQSRNTKMVKYDKHEEFNNKRHPVCHPGNNQSRLKRVVSCKRKTHHLPVVRRKQLGPGRNCDATNKENERKYLEDKQQEKFYLDPLEFSRNVNINHRTGGSDPEQSDYSLLSELTKDHNTMTNVLFERNLRLKVALTLWQRNVGELLTYFIRIQDTGVVVDFLPLISKCIDGDSLRITIGCCVDLFPLVRKVLSYPYEEYITVGIKWIYSVLKNWWKELKASGYNKSNQSPLDQNFQVFNQQLSELWHQEPLLKSITGAAGDVAKVIDSFLLQLQ